MGTYIKRLEDAFGGRLERKGARTIPGTIQTNGVATIYFLDHGRESYRKQLSSILRQNTSPYAKHGGGNEPGCKIHVQSGQTFSAFSFQGDLEGWRKDFEYGVQALDLLMARIEGDKFMISDGRSIPLAECRIEFY